MRIRKNGTLLFIVIIAAILLCFGIISFNEKNGLENSESNLGKTIIVAEDGSGDYTTVNEALDNAGYGDIILLHPGIYEEIIVIPDNDISIIGLDKEMCIIKNTSGIYKNTPIYAYGDFLLSNITVEMTTENAGDWVAIYSDEDVGGTYPGYAIHIDHRNEIETGKMHRAHIINCSFYSEAFSAAGIGINNNQIIEFVDCEFIRNTVDDTYRQEFCPGALFVHASNYESKNEKLILENCEITTNYGMAARFYMTLPGEKDAEIMAINNAFWSEELKTGDCIEYDKGESRLNKKSSGNSANCLNYE